MMHMSSMPMHMLIWTGPCMLRHVHCLEAHVSDYQEAQLHINQSSNPQVQGRPWKLNSWQPMIQEKWFNLCTACFGTWTFPQEAVTVLYEDNDACTAMGNEQKPIPHTQHIDVKYFAICEWIERDLMHMERIDITINMSNHFTKGLSRALFHWHAEYLLGYIPPACSPIYASIVGTYTNQDVDLKPCMSTSFTTPMMAAAARIYAPVYKEYVGNPCMIVLWHGKYNLVCICILDCGGVLP
jgi:hypothetical protein